MSGLALSMVCAGSSEIEVVSKVHTNSARSVGDSLGIELSADGRWAAITSSANGLVPNFPDQGTEFELQVYARDLQTMEFLRLRRILR
jgi:hypothetical protein